VDIDSTPHSAKKINLLADIKKRNLEMLGREIGMDRRRVDKKFFDRNQEAE
jgi:hypothetical protein